ncbi:MAG: hypothetical protein IT372_41410, partial [Polyangiaceae bacterium]|nr:hypothetical protein [Polyangiaceae bacterium]
GALQSAGGDDLFVAKLDGSGNHVWSKRFGDAADQAARGVSVAGAGVVVMTGGFHGAVDFGGGALQSAGGEDAFVAKLDGAGNHVWSERFGDAADQTGGAVHQDGSGLLSMTGSFAGTIQLGGAPLTSAGGADVFVAQLDAAGNHVASGSYGGPAGQHGRAIARDSGGQVLVTGDADGLFALAGDPSAGTDSDIDAFLIRGAPGSGTIYRYGDEETRLKGSSVAVDSACNAIVAGYLTAEAGIGAATLDGPGPDQFGSLRRGLFLAKIDPAGNHVWSRMIGPASEIRVAVDPADHVIVAGDGGDSVSEIDLGAGPMPGPGYAFVGKLDPAGGLEWGKRFGTNLAQVHGLAVDAAGGVLLTGHFKDSLTFGGVTLTSAPAGFDWLTDTYVARLDPSGAPVFALDIDRADGAGDAQIGADGAGDVVFTCASGVATTLGAVAIPSNSWFVGRLSASGAVLGAQVIGGFGGQDSIHLRGLAVRPAGGIVLAGSLFGSVDFGGGPLFGSNAMFLLGLDAQGAHAFSQVYSATSVEPFDLAADAAGDLVATGKFEGSVSFGGPVLASSGGHRVFVVKLDPTGNHLWSRGFGEPAGFGHYQTGNSITADAHGYVYVTGMFYSHPLDLGGGPLASVGRWEDGFAARLAP